MWTYFTWKCDYMHTGELARLDGVYIILVRFTFFVVKDIDMFEIIHKSGEPNPSNLDSLLLNKSVVKKDKLINVIKCRKIEKYNIFDNKPGFTIR